jgi:uncharacterized protein YjbI with pentapeptide repeats
MAEEFEGRDLEGAGFWGVDLTGARFRERTSPTCP